MELLWKYPCAKPSALCFLFYRHKSDVSLPQFGLPFYKLESYVGPYHTRDVGPSAIEVVTEIIHSNRDRMAYCTCGQSTQGVCLWI